MAFPEIAVRIQDFRAIKDANLKLNGLTVLSGLNGSGKSTIAKTLYYAIRTGLRYDSILEERAIRKISTTLYKFASSIRDLGISLNRAGVKVPDGLSETAVISGRSEDEIIRSVRTCLEKAEVLSEKINELPEESRERFQLILNWANRALVLDGSAPVSVADAIQEKHTQKEISEEFLKSVKTFCDETEKKKQNRSMVDFCELCRTLYDIIIPKFLSYCESGVEIFESSEDRVRNIQSVENVFYIDTPWIIDFAENSVPAHAHWSDLIDEIKDLAPADDKEQFSREIAKVISGRVTWEKNAYSRYRLSYKRSDGDDFELKEAATGIKSFSLIQLLAEKYRFDEKTLLILDEPESHLHPQWIVEYARILVLMQKELGVKMLIASHSPDMIEAIQEFAKREGISNRTNFYLAEEIGKDAFSYEYKPLGISVAKIFKVFNVATKRILDYPQE